MMGGVFFFSYKKKGGKNEGNAWYYSSTKLAGIYPRSDDAK